MANVVAELVAKLTLDSAGFKQGVEEAGRIAGKLGDGLKAVGAAATVMAGALTVAGAATFAMIKQVANQGDQFFTLSQRIGMSVEQLSAFRVAAELSDVSIEEFGQSIAFLSRRMEDARAGGKEAMETFGRLGVSFQGDTADVLARIADKFATMPDGAAKTAAAMDLMSRGGARMVPVLNEGAKGLQAMADMAQRLGVVWSTDTARAADAFNDSLTLVRLSIEGLKRAIFADLIPVITPYIDALRDWIAANRELIAQNIKEYVEALATSAAQLLPLIQQIAMGFGQLMLYLPDAVRYMGMFAEIMITGVAKALEVVSGGLANWLGLWAKIPGLTGLLTPLVDELREFSDLMKFTAEAASEGFVRFQEGGAGPVRGGRPSTDRTLIRPGGGGSALPGTDDYYNRAKAALALQEEVNKLGADSQWQLFEAQHKLNEAKTKEDYDQAKQALEILRDELAVRAEAWKYYYQFIAEQQKQSNETIADLEEAATEKSFANLQQLRQEQAELRAEFTSYFSAVGSAFSRSIQGVVQGTQTISEAFRNMGQNILLTISDMIINKGLKQLQDALWEVISPYIQQGLGGLLSSMSGASSSGSFDTAAWATSSGAADSGFVGFQSGGVVTRPTLSLLGEGGEAEAIVPLSRAGEFGFGGGGGVTQNIIVNAGVPETVRREINAMRPQLQRDAVEALLEARNRGGGVAKSFGERQK